MMPHIDEASGHGNGPEGGFNHCFGMTNEGEHGSVGGFARISVEQADTFYTGNRRADLVEDAQVAPFRKVGHTFNDWIHGTNIIGC